jgi:hypothetical protein
MAMPVIIFLCCTFALGGKVENSRREALQLQRSALLQELRSMDAHEASNERSAYKRTGMASGGWIGLIGFGLIIVLIGGVFGWVYFSSKKKRDEEGTAEISPSSKLSPGVDATLLAYHLAAPRLSELRTAYKMNLMLSVFALAFVSIQVVEFWINQYPNECHPKSQWLIPEEERNETAEFCVGKVGAWGDYEFHLLEFWATFLFNICDILALFYAPKDLQTVFFSPILLKLVVALQIACSFVSAMIITINMPLFEVWSHEIEYIDEMMLAFVDVILFLSLVRSTALGSHDRYAELSLLGNAIVTIAAVSVAFAQWFIYNFNGWGPEGFPNGEPAGEKSSHDLEFIFSFFSGFVTFWFTLDNALLADVKIKEIFRGNLCCVGLEDMDTEVIEGAYEGKSVRSPLVKSPPSSGPK